MKLHLKYKQFGSDNGRPIIYFHGAPGSPEECAVFDRYGKENGLKFICFSRFGVDASIVGEAYYQLLATEISKQAQGRKIDVIGFSIGAFIAVQACRYVPDEIGTLHLVSAAGPLEASGFVDAMAGKRVFKLAKEWPTLFTLFSYGQRVLALFFPNALFRLLFASAAGEDKTMAADPEFQSSLTKVLRSCFVGHLQGYIRDIKAYVEPWEATLSECSVNTHIWHGAEDNWSPKTMAEYFKSAIPDRTCLDILDHLSHYSCLYKTAPQICDLLIKERHRDQAINSKQYAVNWTSDLDINRLTSGD